MTSSSELISKNRDKVYHSYMSAKADNDCAYVKQDDKASAEYIFQNQREDANNIVQLFYSKNCRAVSVPKVTKVGADGLMIQVATLLTTHPDDGFVVDPDNVRIITGMSNASWSKDMITKAPSCFKDKIFHHGKLLKANLRNLKNALIIIDEVDTGNKESQVLHKTLKESGVLDVEYMEKHNIRFVFISATMIKEYYDLYGWGKLHEVYKMTIPDSYIGHRDFLEKGILKEFYNLTTKENAEKWVKEDIIDNYGTDNRVHIVRLSKNNAEIENACIRYGVVFMNNNSANRLSAALEKKLFRDPLTKHIVLGVKGFYRRANLIPNSWKIRIGATHELYTEKVDNNVQIQGLPGRMTGYWRDTIEGGHKTGPYRTSIKAMTEYLETYDNPLGLTSYHTNGFTKDQDGKVSAQPTMLSSHNIANLEPIDLPSMCIKGPMPIVVFTITNEEKCKFKNKSAILEVIRKYDEETYVKYSTYHIHCWIINNATKVSKWGLNAMLKPGALSTTTNLTSEERAKQVLMIYLYENKLLLSPWDGAS